MEGKVIITANEHLDQLMRIPTNERFEDCNAYISIF